VSNALAVAAVTATLRNLLEESLGGDQPGSVGQAVVTTLRPDEIVLPGQPEATKGINVFLYQVAPNHSLSPADLPTRDAAGGLMHTPMTAIDLHYLISCHGADAALESQRLLARAMLALTVTPVLTRDVIAAMVERFRDDPDLGFLTKADLGQQPELVKLAPTVLSLEELSRLWGVLGTPYILSVTYVATVVLLQPRLIPRLVLPVRRPVSGVAPMRPMRLTQVKTTSAGEPVVTGTRLTLVGAHLLGGGQTGQYSVQIGPAKLTPLPDSADERVNVLIGEDVPAGVHAIQVVQRRGEGTPAGSRVTGRSDALPVVVRPAVAVRDGDANTIHLALTPPVQPGQDITVTIDRLDAGAPPPHLFEFPVPVGDTPLSEVELDRTGVPAGRWRVQVRVDGVDSLPALTGETYLGPELVLA
jgi:hypothetical protein